MTPIESTGVATVEAMDRSAQHVIAKPREEVVVRRHQTEAVAVEEVRSRELRHDVDGRVEVAVIFEDVLLGDRAGRDVEETGVRGTHRTSVPDNVTTHCTNSVKSAPRSADSRPSAGS